MLPAGSVAVAVKNWPTGTASKGPMKLALPPPSVVTLVVAEELLALAEAGGVGDGVGEELDR